MASSWRMLTLSERHVATVTGRASEVTSSTRRVGDDGSRPALCLVAAPLATVVAAVGLGRLDAIDPHAFVELALVVVWAGSAVVVGVRRRSERTVPVMLTLAGLIALLMLGRAEDRALVVSLALALLAASAMHLLAVLPNGEPRADGVARTAAVGYALAIVFALLVSGSGAVGDVWVWLLLWAAALGSGLRLANVRYRAASPAVRRRMQWVGWAIVVVVEVALVIVALGLMATWPAHPATVALAATGLVPLSIVAATHDRTMARVDRLLTATVSAAGLTALVIAAYGTVVIARGRALEDGERSLLLLSMLAAAIAAVAFVPLRTRLSDVANQVVYGERIAPDEALRTWGSRLTRAIPLDELLLQLAESLRKSMSLTRAEIFTGTDGVYELAAGVPHRSVEAVRVPDKERGVVARAGVSGGTWVDVWLPSLSADDGISRVAPIAHGGELLGLVVVTRSSQSSAFSDDDDRVLTELARQVGLALHNVQLDSALQASLRELQQTNVELQESRRRIVTAGDAERRKLERNLHDGAQQHLVAMAVKLRIAEDLIDEQPGDALDVIGELRRDLKDAIAELRALAHGIYPPLLSSGGLSEALPNAASRAALPTTVDTADVGRFGAEVESTVYFCCLEAIQNAGKHAGPDAEIAVHVERCDGRLVFSVSDNGVGFAVGPAGSAGHGFVNMADRLGTIGGRLTVTSAPGHGTTIRGEIPL